MKGACSQHLEKASKSFLKNASVSAVSTLSTAATSSPSLTTCVVICSRLVHGRYPYHHWSRLMPDQTSRPLLARRGKRSCPASERHWRDDLFNVVVHSDDNPTSPSAL